jgi:WD40 repeat protein
MFEHDDDILCLAVCSNARYCATGQVGPEPLICVWDTETMKVLAKIKGRLSLGIKNICFSKDDEYIAASGMDANHSIAIFKWRTGECIASCNSGLEDVWSLNFLNNS